MASNQQDDSTIHHHLSQWIIKNGGHIHKSLALCTPDTIHEDHPSASTSKAQHYSRRGIFAKHAPIKKGEELIRLAEKLALDGKDFPVAYGDDKNASPWLRCLASLLQSWHIRDGMLDSHSEESPMIMEGTGCYCYLDSLPEIYDSLLDWTSWELRSFLAGTSLGTFAMAGIDNSPDAECYDERKEDFELEQNMHKRYQTTVVPYLKYLKMQHGFFEDNGACCVGGTTKNDNSDATPGAKRQKLEDDNSMDHLYKYFIQGCKCISTRAFHMQLSSDNAGYQGPYLLPYIDLLNHASHGSPNHVTTLQRDPNDGSFVMVAERDIERGEEICHSYDSGAVNGEAADEASPMSSSLNSAQLLQTFGFVDTKSVKWLSNLFQTKKSLSSNEYESFNLTPAILAKDDICRVCKDVSRSTYPDSLRCSMDESGLSEEGWEYWELPAIKDSDEAAGQTGRSNSSRQRALESLPDEVIVTGESHLSDEIITICALNFLPEEAIDELCEDSGDKNEQSNVLLTEEVLDDYFLGKLVLHSLLLVVDKKMKRYKVFIGKDDMKGDTAVSSFLRFIRSLYKVTGDNPFCWGDEERKDFDMLRKLDDTIDGQNDAVLQDLNTKFKCGMTVSLEERACLLQMKKAVLYRLMQLDEN